MKDEKLRDSYETPEWLFNWLDKKYEFNLDVAATDKNSKCEKHTENGLLDDWNSGFECGWQYIEEEGRVFCNPPYSNIMPWLSKAQNEIRKGRCQFAVFILPQDLSTKWGKFCTDNASRITFLVGGRVQFVAPEGIKESSNTKGTMIVEFKGMYLTTEYIDIKEILEADD